MIFILDRENLKTIAVLSNESPEACPYFNDEHLEQLENGLMTYTFTAPQNREEAAHLDVENYVLIRDLDGQYLLFQIKEVVSKQQGGDYYVEVFAENAAVGDLLGEIVRPQTFNGYTAKQALDAVLQNTGWKSGRVDWLGSESFEFKNYPTVLQAVHEIRRRFKADIYFRVDFKDGRVVGKYVDLLKRRGRETGKRFEYAKDIEGITRTEDSSELATALIGVGPSDENGNRLTFQTVVWSKENGDPVDKPSSQDFVGDPEALQRWGKDGKHIFGVYEDPDAPSPEALLRRTWEALQTRNKPKLTYEVSVILLEHLTGYEHEKVRLGDTVTVIDKTFSPELIVEARAIELRRSYSDPTKDSVVLGEFKPLVIDTNITIESLQERINQNAGKWEASGETITKSPTAPEEPKHGELWLDTSVYPNVLYRYDEDEGQWIKASPTEAAEVGAETEEGAQQKADAAERNAKAHADDLFNQANQRIQQAEHSIEETKTRLDSAEQRLQQAEADIDAANQRITDEVNRLDEEDRRLEQLTIDLSEDAYERALADAKAYAVGEGEVYNGVSITNSDGFLAVRSDGLVRTVLNATNGIAIQNRESTSEEWQTVLYADTNGKLRLSDAIIAASGSFTGSITASSAVFTGDITAENATLTGTINAPTATVKDLTVENAVIKNADIQDATITGTLHSVDGVFTGTLDAVNGTFTGTLQAVSGSFTSLLAGNPSGARLSMGESGGLPFLEMYDNNEIRVKLQQDSIEFFADGESQARVLARPETADRLAGLDFDVIRWMTITAGAESSGRFIVWRMQPAPQSGYDSTVRLSLYDDSGGTEYIFGTGYAAFRNLGPEPPFFNLTVEGNINDVVDIRGLHNRSSMLRDHLNGNVTVSAQGNNLYLGYFNTNRVHTSAPLYVDNGIYIQGYSRFLADSTFLRLYAPNSTTNQIRVRDDGQVAIYTNGAFRHVFNPDGTKSGGSIEIEGQVYGMSPVDSPRIMLEDIIFNVEIDGEKWVELDETFAKGISEYTVFSTNPNVEIVEKEQGRFKVRGKGKADFNVKGLRVGYEDVYWMDMQDDEGEVN